MGGVVTRTGTGKSPWAALGSFLLLAFASGCGGGDGASTTQNSPGAAAGDQSGAMSTPAPGGSARPARPGDARAAAVEVTPAQIGSIARTLTVSGVVEPIRTVGVNSQLSGALVSVLAEEGNMVRAGQVLARLDDRELQAELVAAEAAFQVAEAAYQRAVQLRDRQVITLPEYERERTAHAATKARLDQVRTRLGFATITATIAGVITKKEVEAGDVVASQSRLFDLADLSVLVVRVQVSELDVVHLREGNPVSIGLDAFPGRELRGRIRRVFPAADPTTRLVPVEVALEGEAMDLARPGFLARATFALEEHTGVLLVPASAVTVSGGSEAVFVVKEGKAEQRQVTTGLIWQGRVEILSGLRPDEVVVIAGNNALQHGTPVRVVSAPGGGSTR